MSSSENRKVTYSLPVELLGAMEVAVRDGAAPSYSAFVAQAIRERLNEVRERQLREAFSEAAADSLFLEDLEDTMEAFSEVDGVVEGPE